MDKTEALMELAERCEQATGPDRVTDAAIAERLEPWRLQELRAIREADGNYGHLDDMRIFNASPAYTASLDAAMTLKPEEYFVRLDDLGFDGLPLAQLYGVDQADAIGTGRDLTLSLCAAALRARATQSKDLPNGK